ncbi:MAG: TolB family protein, partial [Planctomycetota bacterium]
MAGRVRAFCIYLAISAIILAAFPALAANNTDIQINTPETARRMIMHLSRAFGEKYPNGKDFLEQLDKLSINTNNDEFKAALEDLTRKAALASPLFDFDKLLFTKRYTYGSNHYYTDFINGSQKFGGNICVLSLSEGKVTELVPQFEGGIFGRFDLSFDGKRVVFGYKAAIGKGYRIYEIGIDGTGLRQLTFDPPDEKQRIAKYKINDMYQHHTDDMHPCYLPDGGICFISSRCEYGILCNTPDVFTTTVLYRMDGDGTNMVKLTNSSVSEASPSVMNDGRILYTRWEYVDKGAVSVKCLWSIHPDGSYPVEIYANDIALPPTFIHGQAIAGHNNLYVVAGTPHYPQGRVGTIIRLDINYPVRTRQP